MYGKMGGAYRVLMKRPKGRRLFARPRRRWENKSKLGPQDVE
jgi:hypothetical protein